MTGLFGNILWWMYIMIPAFAIFKVLSYLLPIVLPYIRNNNSSTNNDNNKDTQEGLSKRQAKLKQRQNKKFK